MSRAAGSLVLLAIPVTLLAACVASNENPEVGAPSPAIFGSGLIAQYASPSGRTLEFLVADPILMKDESGMIREGLPLIVRVDGESRAAIYLNSDGSRFASMWMAPYFIRSDGSHEPMDARTLAFFDQGSLAPFLIGSTQQLYKSQSPTAPLSQAEPHRSITYSRENVTSTWSTGACARLDPTGSAPREHGRESTSYLRVDGSFVICDNVPVAVSADFTALGGSTYQLVHLNSAATEYEFKRTPSAVIHATSLAPDPMLPARGGAPFDVIDATDAFDLAKREHEGFARFVSQNPRAILMSWGVSKEDGGADISLEDPQRVLSRKVSDRLLKLVVPGTTAGYEAVFEAYERTDGAKYVKLTRAGEFTAERADARPVHTDQLTLRSGFERAQDLIGSPLQFSRILRVISDANGREAWLDDRFELEYWFDGTERGPMNFLHGASFDSSTGRLLKVSGTEAVMTRFVPMIV